MTQHTEGCNASAVYQQFERLTDVTSGGVAGELLLAWNEDAERVSTEAVVRAANIAGAATLLICVDMHQARLWARSGVADILVTSLDEALRILKNELRRRLSTTVCLVNDPRGVLAECVARGVQPDILAREHRVLSARGARVLGGTDGEGASIRGARKDPMLRATRVAEMSMIRWRAQTDDAGLLASLDTAALRSLEPGVAAERLLWLRRARQYLDPREAMTCMVPMQKAEALQFCEAARYELRRRGRQGITDDQLRIWDGGMRLL